MMLNDYPDDYYLPSTNPHGLLDSPPRSSLDTEHSWMEQTPNYPGYSERFSQNAYISEFYPAVDISADALGTGSPPSIDAFGMTELLPISPHNQVATSSTLPSIAEPEQLLAAKEYLRTGRPCAYKDNGVLDHDAMNLNLGDFTTGLIAENIARRLAHELKLYQIPQEVFGKQVLSRSQGTLSELLKSPKPWKMLTLKGQETYTKMYKWLMLSLEYKLSILDKHAAEKKKTCAKRRLQVSPDSDGPVARRIRFSDDQKNTLFGVYEKCANPNAEMLQMIAKFMEISAQAVSNFFGNARRRTRRQQSIAMTPQLEELLAVLSNNFDQFHDAL